MSARVATLLLFHEEDFWQVEINGLLYSEKQTFKKNVPNIDEKDYQSQEKSASSRVTLLLTCDQEPGLKCHKSKPPLHLVTPLLGQLTEFGYQVASSDSTSDENGYRKTTLWTFQRFAK